MFGLLHLLFDCEAMRDCVFRLRGPQILSLEDHNAYWPWMLNFWSFKKVSPVTIKGEQISYYWCRLYPKEQQQPTSKGERKRGQRVVNHYGIKLSMIKKH